MDGTILSQGTFIVPAGGPVVQAINIPSGVDWMRVFNYTRAAAGGVGGQNYGVSYYWQRGMPAGGGIIQYGAGAVLVLSNATMTAGGFTLLDTSVQTPGPINALTGITAANPPVVASVATPPVGSVVRIINPNNQLGIGGKDFTVTANNPGVSFTIGNINLLNTVASNAGFWRQIVFDPIFYPRNRLITFIRVAAQAVVYLSVTHQYAVGQRIRLNFGGGSNPGIWGAWQALDGVEASIVAVNVARAGTEPNNGGTANNIVLNIDTTAFPAWDTINAAFPNTNTGNTAYPAGNTYVESTPAQVVPVGQDSALSLSSPLAQVPLNYDGTQVQGTQTGLLSDAVVNTAFMGMALGTGGVLAPVVAAGAAATGPAGSLAGDVVYWLAGKSSLGGL